MTVAEVLVIAAMLFFASSASAHKISSWEPYKSLFEHGECQKLISHLKPLSKPLDWYDNRMWSRSRILNSKCQMQLENYKAALKSLKQTPESEERDVWLFQKIRVLIKSGNQSKAIANIKKLLKLPEKKSYLQSLRDDLKNEFHTDKEVRILFPLLHETRKNYKWFLSDYDLHTLYIRGAKLKGIKPEHKYRVLGWQFPIDEKSARQSHKNLTAKDLKNMSPAELLKRVRTLTRLGLNNYLVKHLPQLRKWRSRKVLKKLGKAYLKALFVERFYYRTIIFQKKGQLSKLWSLPKEIQLYWTARSFIKRRNIPDARSTIYKLERLNAKSKLLPDLFNTFAIRYMLDSEIEKSRFWWNRLLSHFPNQELIVETDENQNKADNQRKSGQNEKQEEAENTVRGVVNENYSRWFLLGCFLFFSFTSVAITLLILLWPEYQSGKIYDVLLSDNKSFLFVKSEVAQSYLMQTTSESSFIQAVKKENLAEVERFIDEGVDLELKDLNGYTPLMHAVKQQNTELVKLLAEYGANVDTSDGLEDTPLVWASSMKNEAIVKVLLEHGADPDKGNFSPLMWAAYYGNLRLVKMFLESRANLNSRTNEGWTALMWAAERGNLQVIWELLKRGASVNMQNNNGQTALMLAAGRGRTGSVGLLLNKGGDVFVVDFNKKTAADYARSKQRNEVLQILEKEFELR